MTLLNSGTTKKYSENWTKAFGASTAKSTAKAAKKASAAGGTKKKKAPAKKAGKR